MGTSDAQKRASLKWEQENNEKITVKLRVGKDPERAMIQYAAEQAGLSVNAWIIEAIREKLKAVDTTQTNPQQITAETGRMVSLTDSPNAREMTLEQFKSKVAETLMRIAGKREAEQIMTAYEKDFPQFYKENWSVAGITAGMLNGI